MKFLHRVFPFLLAIALTLTVVTTVLAQDPPPGNIYTGDKLVVGSNYTLYSGDTLDGSLVVLGGNAEIQSDATITGDIAVLGGNVNFAGIAKGTINAIGGNINLKPGAVINGNISTLGGNVSGIDQAEIDGNLETMNSPERSQDNAPANPGEGTFMDRTSQLRNYFGEIFGNIFKILAIAVLAVIVAAVMPKPMNTVARSIENQPWLSGGVGLLSFIIVPLAALIMTVTLVLIPVMIVGVLAYVVITIFGWIAAGKYLGDRLAILFKTTWADPVSAGLGTLIIGVVTWLFSYLFCLGGVLSLAVSALGIGGVILSKFGQKPYDPNTGLRGVYGAAPAPVTENSIVESRVILPPAEPPASEDPSADDGESQSN